MSAKLFTVTVAYSTQASLKYVAYNTTILFYRLRAFYSEFVRSTLNSCVLNVRPTLNSCILNVCSTLNSCVLNVHSTLNSCVLL